VALNSDLWGTRGYVAIGLCPTDFWIDEVLTGYDPDASATQFTMGDLVPAVTGCGVARPTPPVITVIARESGRDLGISHQSMEVLSRAADRLITNYARSGYRGGLAGVGNRLELVDVVVDTDAQPVHLVLISTREALVWSLQLAPDAKLSGVTLVGGQAGGILNLPFGVPIEAATGPALADCGIDVMIYDHHDRSGRSVGQPLVKDVTTPSVLDTPIAAPVTLQPLKQAIDAAPASSFRLWKAEFERWFTQQFRQNPRRQIAGYADAQLIIAHASGPFIVGAPVERVLTTCEWSGVFGGRCAHAVHKLDGHNCVSGGA
jgi:hypothetical protein